MSDQVVIIKSTKDGFHADTVLVEGEPDTLALSLDVSGTSILELPDSKIDVQTPGKDWFDYTLGVITIIGAIVTIVYTLKSIKKLFERDEQREEQIAELAAQTEQLILQTSLFERRLRMQVKPRIWTNGGGYSGHNNEVRVSINNRGELCHLQSIEQLDGDEVHWYDWKDPIALPKDKSIRLTGTSLKQKSPKAEFRLKALFQDQEGYQYEVVFHWKSGKVRVESTREL